jgi:hypothetical protein
MLAGAVSIQLAPNLPFELVNLVSLIENQETKSNVCIIHHNNKILGYNI